METIAANTETSFAPVLYMPVVADALVYYQKAFKAVELRRWSGGDGTIHVAEMTIGNAMFHLHEITGKDAHFNEQPHSFITLGLFTANPDMMMQQALDAGGKLLNPMQDYDYGYRQGDVLDPFGHKWTLQQKI